MAFDSALDEYLRVLFKDQYESFIHSEPEPRAIRVNCLKSDEVSIERLLKKYQYSINKIPFSKGGYILENDSLPLSHTLSYFKGKIMYQGISSQLPAQLLDVHPGDYVLDIAAAPGSKSTQLSAHMQNGGYLILNDFSTTRMQALNANMQRSGAINHAVLKLRGQDLGPLLPEFFDKVLCDVPCTSTGTLNSNPEIRSWWSMDRLFKLTHIQYYLLVSAIKTLKVGGELVYSTCSVTPEENECVIERVLKTYPVEIVAPDFQYKRSFNTGFKSYKSRTFDPAFKYAVRIQPHRHHMEGFFMIKLRKTGSLEHAMPARGMNWRPTMDMDHPAVAPVLSEISNEWGISEEEWCHYRYYMTRTRLWMLNGDIKSIPDNGFISAGLLLAEKRIYGWKLVTASVQFFVKYINKKIIELPVKSVQNLFRQGKITYSGIRNGYYALQYNGESLASVFVQDGHISVRLPHPLNILD